MLSRRDVRPSQTQILLEAGFLPISVDYRLCPETTLLEGPMHDVRSALRWARHILPKIRLQRADIHPNSDRVVAVGWSTGGHLAMTLAWTAPSAGLKPPDAILAFYCPSDYEDPFWTQPNIPRGTEPGATEDTSHDIWEGVYSFPITAYNPSPSARALGGWMAPEDARSRICLFMNWHAMTLPILVHGMKKKAAHHHGGGNKRDALFESLPPPSLFQIQDISPFAQIKKGVYKTPTFIVHGTRDDLIPWQQAQRTYEALKEKGVEAEIRIVEGGIHLFDTGKGFERDEKAMGAVKGGYEFLAKHVVE